jgi:hypothetical protein
MSTSKKLYVTTRRTARIESTLDNDDSAKYTAKVNVRTIVVRNRSGWGLEFPNTTADVMAFYDLAAAILQERLDANAAAE